MEQWKRGTAATRTAPTSCPSVETASVKITARIGTTSTGGSRNITSQCALRSAQYQGERCSLPGLDWAGGAGGGGDCTYLSVGRSATIRNAPAKRQSGEQTDIDRTTAVFKRVVILRN